MNSKEALEKLLEMAIENGLWKSGLVEDIENIIMKDLDVLEILKRFILVNKSDDDLFPYDIHVKQQYISSKSCLVLTEEEYYKIKEWLKREE